MNRDASLGMAASNLYRGGNTEKDVDTSSQSLGAILGGLTNRLAELADRSRSVADRLTGPVPTGVEGCAASVAQPSLLDVALLIKSLASNIESSVSRIDNALG